MEIFDKLQFPLKNSINTIFGPSGVGKTTVAYLLAKKEILNNKEVYFVDTERGFSKRRFLQIFPEFDKNKNYQELFHLVTPNSFEEQNEFLRKINIKNSVLIVDSISMLYRLELKDNYEEINKEMAKTLKILLDKTENNKILLISHSYFKDLEHKIVGGDLLKYYSKVLIEMFFEGGKRKMRLVKHKFLPQKEFGFEIKEDGIKLKRFFF